MERRTFLSTAGRAAASLLAGGLLGSGCVSQSSSHSLVLRGWPYEPDLVRAILHRFRAYDATLPVDYAPFSGNYHDKLVALFVAQTPLDLIFVRDDHFAEWVEAGWLQPIDDLPGALDYREDMFAFNWDALTHRGRLYGLPYYGDFTIWVWNRRYLEAAGFERCGRTLEEITEQCRKLKERRIAGPRGTLEYPLVFNFRQAPIGFNDFWSLMYASEARLFTEDLEPMFPDDEGRRCERVLQWLVDGIHRHRIIDLDASFTVPQPRDLFTSGRSAMLSVGKYELQRINDPRRSDVAGDALMSPYPSLEPGQNGTLGWTRMYCLPTHCRHRDAAWKLMEFLGGRDPDGAYSTAKFWYLQKGLGFAFPSLLDDPEVIASTAAWGDIDQLREQARYARTREVIKAPWFAEFDQFYQAEVQEILQRRTTPRDGLARIAAHCRRLRKNWA